MQKLNVMRLAPQVNVLKRPEDYKEMAQLALEEKLAGEAQAVLEQGFQQEGVQRRARRSSVNNRLLTAAKKEAAADKATLAKHESRGARPAATGDADVKVGAQYLSYGDPAKAADRRALPRAASPRATRRKRSASTRPASCSASPTCATTTRPKPRRRSAP